DEHQERLVVVAGVDRTGQLSAGLVERSHPLSFLRLFLLTLSVQPAAIGEEDEQHRRDKQWDPDRTRAPDQGGEQADREVACGMQEVETVGKHQRSEEHTSELQSRGHLVCRLLLEKKKKKKTK